MIKLFRFRLLLLLTLFVFHISFAVEPLEPRYIHVKELLSAFRYRKPVVVLDVRSEFAYEKEHIKGALSLPLTEIRTSVLLQKVPHSKMIVTYCSCPHHLASMAADTLKSMGYENVFVLDEGLPGWKKAGYPLQGQLANKPLSIYWVIGYVYGPNHHPLSNVDVRVFHQPTEQLEMDKSGKNGFYALLLRFYELKPGDELQIAIGKDLLFFTVGSKSNPWGIRIDDEASHIMALPRKFLSTFKARKLHP